MKYFEKDNKVFIPMSQKVSMNKVSFLIVLMPFLALLIFNCSGKSEGEKSPIATAEALPEELAKGHELAKVYCFNCHSPEGGIEKRLAPPMIAIKKHYIDEHTTLASFTEQLIAYVQQPDEDISRMPGARKRFGLMPALPLPEAQLTEIASYIYHGDLEKPGWFDQHFQEERKRHGQQH